MKYSIIVLNIILLVYFFASIIKNCTDFIPIEGTLLSIEKSGNRIPYYSFKLEEFDCIFQNKGNSFLALLTNNKNIYNKIHKQKGINRKNSHLFDTKDYGNIIKTDKVVFYINKKDNKNLYNNRKVFYAGLRFIDQPEKLYTKIIDSYYYTLRNGKSIIYICLFFIFSATLAFIANPILRIEGFNLMKLLFFTDFGIFILLMIL